MKRRRKCWLLLFLWSAEFKYLQTFLFDIKYIHLDKYKTWCKIFSFKVEIWIWKVYLFIGKSFSYLPSWLIFRSGIFTEVFKFLVQNWRKFSVCQDVLSTDWYYIKKYIIFSNLSNIVYLAVCSYQNKIKKNVKKLKSQSLFRVHDDILGSQIRLVAKSF